MSGWRLPAPSGAWVARDQPLRFSFNDRVVEGLQGDTVASALLASGIRHIGRSFKLHRPRGIFSCGVEEPTGLLDIGIAAARTANTRATDIRARAGMVCFSGNAWPSLEFDVAAVNARLAAYLPAGFYYKTFMWPHWRLFEPAIRRMAGLGSIGEGADPERYDELSLRVEVLVIGGGAAGLQAALSAAQAGRQVLLLEGERTVGGWLATQPGAAERLQGLHSAALAGGVQLRTHCTALGIYDHLLVSAVESFEGEGEAIRERLLKIRAGSIILAAGAIERPMLFPDNDRPGVMLAGAVERYAAMFGVACGRKAVIATACDAGYAVATSLRAAGIEVAAIVDHRNSAGNSVEAPPGVSVHAGSSLIAVSGRRSVQAVTIARHDGSAKQSVDVDLVASIGGFTPNVSLWSQAGGRLRWFDEASMFVPDTALPGLAVVGACAGVFDLDDALAHAEAVGQSSNPAALPQAPIGGLGQVTADNRPTAAALASLGRKAGKQFVDLQNDVATSDVELAARENYRSVEHLKRYTTNGMATDQGKTSNVNALVLMGKATDRTPSQVGTTKFRPPYKPVTLNALVAGRHGSRYRPLKPLPAHDWHVQRGALFEEFGGWHRPAAYPRPGEDLIQAAEREAAQVRHGVGLFDASPLGKIEVYGPDAASFLDLMYVGTLSTLAVGSARYGALLNENGVITDDGIVARLGHHHFLVHTTSGGADKVALDFEEWLQCEYVNLRVLIVPMTSQWGNVTVSGPQAWTLLSRLGFDPSLSPLAMQAPCR